MIEYYKLSCRDNAQYAEWVKRLAIARTGCPGLIGRFAASLRNGDYQLCELNWAWLDD